VGEWLQRGGRCGESGRAPQYGQEDVEGRESLLAIDHVERIVRFLRRGDDEIAEEVLLGLGLPGLIEHILDQPVDLLLTPGVVPLVQGYRVMIGRIVE